VDGKSWQPSILRKSKDLHLEWMKEGNYTTLVRKWHDNQSLPRGSFQTEKLQRLQLEILTLEPGFDLGTYSGLRHLSIRYRRPEQLIRLEGVDCPTLESLSLDGNNIYWSGNFDRLRSLHLANRSLVREFNERFTAPCLQEVSFFMVGACGAAILDQKKHPELQLVTVLSHFKGYAISEIGDAHLPQIRPSGDGPLINVRLGYQLHKYFAERLGVRLRGCAITSMCPPVFTLDTNPWPFWFQ